MWSGLLPPPPDSHLSLRRMLPGTHTMLCCRWGSLMTLLYSTTHMWWQLIVWMCIIVWERPIPVQGISDVVYFCAVSSVFLCVRKCVFNFGFVLTFRWFERLRICTWFRLVLRIIRAYMWCFLWCFRTYYSECYMYTAYRGPFHETARYLVESVVCDRCLHMWCVRRYLCCCDPLVNNVRICLIAALFSDGSVSVFGHVLHEDRR